MSAPVLAADDHELIALCDRLVEIAAEERGLYATTDDEDEREVALGPLDEEGLSIHARLRELGSPVSRAGAAAMALAALADIADPGHRNELTAFGEWLSLTARTFLAGPAAAVADFEPTPIRSGEVTVSDVIAFVNGLVAGIAAMARRMGGLEDEAIKTLLYGLALGMEDARPGSAWTMERARLIVRSVESRKSVSEYIPVRVAREGVASTDAFETGDGFGVVSS
jgi:hypothetical protein